jgi:hypothetical protein
LPSASSSEDERRNPIERVVNFVLGLSAPARLSFLSRSCSHLKAGEKKKIKLTLSLSIVYGFFSPFSGAFIFRSSSRSFGSVDEQAEREEEEEEEAPRVDLAQKRRGANTSHFTSTRLNIYCCDKN